MSSRPRLPLLLLALLAPFHAMADTAPQNEGALQFVGDTARIGIGVMRGGHMQGELMGVLDESSQSAWLGEAWFSRAAGGLQLDYHSVGATMVSKYFVAVDQNTQHDRKLTLGYGQERADWFGNAYLSRGFSDRRELGQTTATQQRQQSGTEDGRPFLDTITTTSTTRLFERAYDYGVGVRLGHYVENIGLRLTGGVDYEWGKGDAKQTNLSISAEKFYIGTPHSVALQLDHYRKQGAAEVERSDNRALLTYRYSFGKANAQSERQFRMVADPVPTVPPTIVPAHTERKLVKTTASMNSDAFFLIGSTTLTEAARTELDRVTVLLKTQGREGNVHIVGHTCDIGTDEVNDKLSVKRAEAVRDYLISTGALTADVALVEGMGKRDPKYPNTAATREKNRRVDLEFVSLMEKEEVVEVPAQTVPAAEPAVTYHREDITQEPAWMRQALRSPTVHKRTVDVYRTEERSQSETRSREWLNRTPIAQDDAYNAVAGIGSRLAVLSNDRDPDAGDTFKLVSVDQAGHGQVSIDGDQVVYTAAADYSGPDSFSYTIQDAQGATAKAQVAVTVTASSQQNRAPIAQNDAYNAVAGVGSRLAVLSNDHDPDAGDTFKLISVDPASHGQVSIDGDQVVYTAAANYSGMDSFSYTIQDAHGATAKAQVAVTVSASTNPNRAPVATNDSFIVSGLTSDTLAVLGNDSDPDGDPLTIVSVTQPIGNVGTVSIVGAKILFTPNHMFVQDTFTYTVSDGRGGQATATVTLIDP